MINVKAKTHNILWVILAITCGVGLALLITAVSAFNDQLVVLFSLGLMGGAVFLILLSYAALGHAWAVSIYLGLTVFLVDASLRGRDFEDISLDWQTLLKLLVWGGTFIIGLMQLPKTYQSLLKPPAILLLFYSLWALISTAYSAIPAYTFASSFALLSFILFAPAVAHVLTLRAVLITITASLGIFISISWAVFFMFPEFGSTLTWTPTGNVYRIDGLANHANGLGRLATSFIAMLFLLFSLRYVRTHLLLAPTILGIMTLAFTQSRSAALALAAALAFVTWRRKPWLLIPTAIVVLAGTFYLNSSSGGSVETLEALSRSGRAEEIITLTGRTDLWAFVIERIEESPWLGYGYGSSRLLISSDYVTRGGWTTTQAHNMILQSLLTLGIIGTLPLLVVFWRQSLDFIRSPNVFRDLMFVYVIIRGLLEAGAIGPVPSTLTLLWFISLFWNNKSSLSGNPKD